MVVIGLGKNLLFKSVLAHCGKRQIRIYCGRMRFGDSSKAHASKYITVYPVIILKALDRTHLQGRKSDKAPKYDGYHLLFTFLFISAPT